MGPAQHNINVPLVARTPKRPTNALELEMRIRAELDETMKQVRDSKNESDAIFLGRVSSSRPLFPRLAGLDRPDQLATAFPLTRASKRGRGYRRIHSRLGRLLRGLLVG